jgi:hypothetical protein
MDKLTVDYKSLLKLGTKERLDAIQSGSGQELMNALTPAQRAALFPSYFRQQGPSVMGAMSGGTAATADVSAPTYSTSAVQADAVASRSGGGGPADSSWVPPAPKSWRERMADLKKPKDTSTTGGSGRKLVGGSTIPKDTDPKVVEAINRVASKHGLDPAAVSMLIKTESNWKSKSKTGSYAGLTQIGPDTVREAGWGFTHEQFRNMSPEKQVEVYGDWLEHYKFNDKVGNAGIDLAKLNPSQQAAILQGFQFSPNGQRFLKAFGQGDASVPATNSRQANVLGDTSIAQMTSYYSKLATNNPAEYEEANPTAVIQQDPNQSGTIQPRFGDDTMAPKAPPPPLTALPDGIDQGIAEQFKSMSPDEQKKLLNEMSGVDVGVINKYYTDDKKSTYATKLAARSLTAAANLQPKFKPQEGKSLTESLPPDTERFFHAGGKLEGVDPKLVHLLKESSKDLPAGYRMEMISGKDARSTGTKNHPNGLAVDVKLYDDKGKALNHGSPGAGWGAYERMYQSVYQRGKMYYPDEDFIWGGAWHSKAAGMGDKMHYQRRVKGVGSQSSGDYNPDKGLSPSKYYLDPTGERLTPDQIAEHRNWVKTRVEAQAAAANPTALIPQDPNQSGTIQPAFDETTVAPKATADPLKDQGPPMDDAGTNPPVAPLAASPVVSDAVTAPAQPQAATPKESGELKAPTAMPVVEQKYDYSHGSDQKRVNADNIFPKDAPSAPKEKPKADTPQMKSGGRVQASGEDFSIVDNNSKKKLGEISRGENINFKKTGQVDVTPDHRIDPKSLEDKREAFEERAKASAESRAERNEVANKPKPMVQPPVNNFAAHEQWGATNTPASYMRAMSAAKGRRDGGAFAGSRFGEDGNANLT